MKNLACIAIIVGFVLKVLMLIGVIVLMCHTAFGADKLTVYVNDAAINDSWSEMAREALIDPIENLEARVPTATEYIAEVREWREKLNVEVVTLGEAGLPSDTVVPAFAFGHRDPQPIRRDVLHYHVSLLKHLDYLCRLRAHLISVRISLKSITVWYTADTETSSFLDGDIVTRIRYTRWRPVIEPYPTGDIQCRWSREITYVEDGVELGRYTIEFEGTPELEVIQAMDSGTGWAEEAIETARSNAASQWNRSLNETFGVRNDDPCQCYPPAPPKM